MIQTVTGKIINKEIHNTLAHEHVVFGLPGYVGDPNNVYQYDVAYTNAMQRMELIKKYDVNFMVDATTIERGRDAKLLQKVSQDSGVSIVCATGFFKDEGEILSVLKGLSYGNDLQSYLATLFQKELLDGIGNTSIKAGVIKVASSLNVITPLEATIMNAASQVHRNLNVPIMTHCDRGTMVLQQATLFLNNGVDPYRVILGHMSSQRDLAIIKTVIQQGFTVGFDQFGLLSIPGIPSDEEKMENLLSLLNEGYEDHIVLSNDSIFDRMGFISKSKPRYPDFVYRQVIPYLHNQHISETTIRKITRDNLLRILDR